MIKRIKGLDLDVHIYNINGLLIYLVPNNKLKGIFASLSVKFGSYNEIFKNGKELIKLPHGTAHFLEHQNFNTENNEDIFSFYSSHGCSCNANTRLDKTTYLFSGVNFFSENLNKLLDFVFNPYFTDESVNKEKGIIKEEIEMYLDDPYVKMMYQIKENMFQNEALNTPVIGSVASINKITKEDLYLAYNSFYNPNNMFLVVAGNIDPDEVKNIVTDNLKNKKFNQNIPTKIYIDEPDKVVKKEETINLKVTIPKIVIGYKFNLNNLKNIKKYEAILYLRFLFENKLGNSSKLLEDLIAKELIIDNFFINSSIVNDHVMFTIQAESNNPHKLYEEVKSALKDLSITEEELKRSKKVLLSEQILGSESNYQVSQKIMNNIIYYGDILYDAYDSIRNLNIKQYNYVIKNVSFNNVSVLYVNGKKDK